jgi:hypothetical protein
LHLAVVVAIVWLAPLAEAKDPHPIVQQAKKLAEPADFPGIDDPQVTLQEALELLTDKFGLRFDINEKAFQVEEVQDVRTASVATKPIPKMTKVRLATVLKKILERVPSGSGTTYVLRRDGIEITTEATKVAEFRNPSDHAPSPY